MPFFLRNFNEKNDNIQSENKKKWPRCINGRNISKRDDD